MAYKSKKQKQKQANKFNAKQNYSKFWMEDSFYKGDRFVGIGSASQSSDIVKLVKLNSYRKAIANFVTILTGQNIPVRFHGNTSYTDGKSVTISTDIKDNNFDVTVGLALHEASHIVLTDFSYLTRMDSSGKHASQWDLWKNLVNWIEDRRIDQFVFSTSPGYKAYYHKMYDYYWNAEKVTKGLKSNLYREPADQDSWLFRIINSLNPASDPNALPELDTILKLIDVGNIKRLKSVAEVGDIASEILEIMNKYINKQGGTTNQPDPGQGEEGDEEGDEEGTELTPAEEASIRNMLRDQKDFLNNKTGKKSATKTLQKKLENLAKNDNISMQTVGEGKFRNNCLIYDLTNSDLIGRFADVRTTHQKLRAEQGAYSSSPELDKASRELRDLSTSIFPYGFASTSVSREYKDAIKRGYDMGGLLGKKLQIRNESRDLVYNRMRTGHIDNRRLSQAGYGVETIFKQVQTDCYKKANLHISLDGSGSMMGAKWANTVQMCMAMVRAATYVQNLDIQVTIRSTGEGKTQPPIMVFCYDSRRNKPQHLINILEGFSPNSYTPEGLCFEGLLARNGFIPSSNELDSYLVNLSDGEPSGVPGYDGIAALQHTKKQVDKMRRELNMGILSFFIEEGDSESKMQRATQTFNTKFKQMYGKDSALVAADEVLAIAKQMNQTFLQKATK